MDDTKLEDRLDRLVAEYSDRVTREPEPDVSDLLEQVDADHRPALERCFRMIRAGLASVPTGARPLGPGSVIDGYRIEREIGRGGMAIVYLAVQEDLNRRVALKVLRAGLAVDRVHVDRFRREGLAIAKLTHPHIVQVHGVGETQGHHWLAMEYIEGTTLEHVLQRLPRDRRWTAGDLAQAAGIPSLDTERKSYEEALASLLAPAARAIGLAHELGLVHRDVKPSNILIHLDGRAVIADFGLAKGEGDPGLSLTGEPLGTPYYMSPEQATLTGNPVDQRSDVYSLGVTLFEALTGQRPYQGSTVIAVLEAIREGTPPSLRSLRRELSRDAEAVVRRCMEHEPSERYPNALDLAAELGALADGRPTQAGAAAGGLRNRVKRTWRTMSGGYTGEYRSERSFLGLPLVHVIRGRRRPGQPMRVARGWLAIGDVAVGGIAFGAISAGGISCGAVSLGIVSWAGIALGVAPVGGIALGLLSYGAIAIGYGAVGGWAAGWFALGGSPHGAFMAGPGHDDIEAVRFVARWMPWTLWFFGGLPPGSLDGPGD